MRFHDRLSIVTKTLEKGAVEIAHFAIMLIIVLGMFTLIAHSSLGTTVEDFPHRFFVVYNYASCYRGGHGHPWNSFSCGTVCWAVNHLV